MVNSTHDDTDLNPGDGLCDTGQLNATGDPECTLRAALVETNATPALGQIDFDIPTADTGHNAGVWTITAISSLPTAANSLLVNGVSQPGYLGTPIIALDGNVTGASTDGLTFNGANSGLSAFSIINFDRHGLVVAGDSFLLTDSYIGCLLYTSDAADE